MALIIIYKTTTIFLITYYRLNTYFTVYHINKKNIKILFDFYCLFKK